MKSNTKNIKFVKKEDNTLEKMNKQNIMKKYNSPKTERNLLKLKNKKKINQYNEQINETENLKKIQNNPKTTPKTQLEINLIKDNEKKDVDSILSNLIPNYNEQISIELNNINLTFETTEDKIDTFKELFVRTINRTKGGSIKVHALKDISFKIYQGEKVGIIGYNGAGKSTLLSVISGVYSPNSGTIKTYGNISPLLSLGAGFDSNYSGRNNILLHGAILGYDKEFLMEKMDEIIEFSELEEYIDLPIKNYSAGMLAKLGFSIATVVNPDILIIDEILGVGDVNFQKKSGDKIKSLMDGQTTVLLVSHSIPQIRNLCDKAIWIDNGKIKEIGEVNKVCDNYLKDAEKATSKQLQNIQFK